MKVLLFTLEYPPFHGGVAEYYGNLVKSWPVPENIYVLDNAKNRLLTGWLWPRWLPAVELLFRAIRKHKINHILVGQILPLGTATYYISKLTHTPYTVILHGMDFTYALRVPRKKAMAEKILKQAKYIICASSYTAKLVTEFLGETDKIKTVNPGIDPAKASGHDLRSKELKEKHKLDGKVVLFSLGRLVKRKGFDYVIKAMAEVVKQNSRVFYFIAGNGPDKRYIYDCAAGIPNIIFLGEIGEEDKWAWLQLCDIFIMPARNIEGDYEGFGIVYLEANLCGKPVIAGDSGGVRDAVKGAVTGIIVDPNNIERIAGAISTLSTDAKLRQTLGEQGRARAISEFSWEKQAKIIFYIING
jgi:phosphatidylinositol alpha-1,6-mannosyltransferase